jgi:hypothetical protein
MSVPLPWRATVAAWPDPARAAFGRRANELLAPGMGNFPEDERVAFGEIAARLAAGEFAGPVGAAPAPARSGRRRPIPATPLLEG